MTTLPLLQLLDFAISSDDGNPTETFFDQFRIESLISEILKEFKASEKQYGILD